MRFSNSAPLTASINKSLPFERLKMRADGIISQAYLSHEIVHCPFTTTQTIDDSSATGV